MGAVEFHLLSRSRGRALAVVEVLLAIVIWYVATDLLTDMLFSGGLGFSAESLLIATGLVIGAWMPATWLAARIVGRNWRQLSSIANRLRWSLLLKLVVIAVVLHTSELALKLVLFVDQHGDEAATSLQWPGITTFLPIALTVLVTVPFQAAGEEYLFRGTLLQSVGAFTPNARVGIVSTAAVFALLHTANVPATIAIFIFGLAMAWLSIRTGGLEAAIAHHVVGNVFGFLTVAAMGDFTTVFFTMNRTTSWEAVAFDVGTTLLFTAVAARVASAERTQSATEQKLSA